MSEKLERDFKGIWIPKEIWLSKDLTVHEKLFLVEIDSLDNDNGCFASNAHFMDFFGLSKNRCSEIIKSLEKKGYVNIQYIREKGKSNIKQRIIKRVFDISNRGIRDFDRPIRDIEGGIRKTGKGVIHINNTYNNNTLSSSSDEKGNNDKKTDEDTIDNFTLSKKQKNKIIEKWNEIGISKIRSLKSDTERYQSLKKRCKDYSFEEVLEGIENIKNSKFLQGFNDRKWKVSFDWFVKPNNFPKVLENQYTDLKEGDEDGNRIDGNGRNNGSNRENNEWENTEVEKAKRLAAAQGYHDESITF